MTQIPVAHLNNFGNEFEIGTEVAGKVTIRVDEQYIIRDPANNDAISLDIAALFASTTNVLSLAGAVLTSTVNGVAATQDLTAAVQAAETVTALGFDNATGVLTYTDEANNTTAINLPLENFLQNASFDSATNVLTLSLADGTDVDVNLADLIDLYQVNASPTIDVTGDGSTATPWVFDVIVDPVAGNRLVAGPNGLVVGAAAVSVDVTGNTLTVDVDGTSDSGDIVTANSLAAGANPGTLVSSVNGVDSNEFDVAALVRTTADVEVQDLFGNTLFYAFSTDS